MEWYLLHNIHSESSSNNDLTVLPQPDISYIFRSGQAPSAASTSGQLQCFVSLFTPLQNDPGWHRTLKELWGGCPSPIKQIIYLAGPGLSCYTWDLWSLFRHVGPSSLAGARTWAPLHWKLRVLAIGPQGRSLLGQFSLCGCTGSSLLLVGFLVAGRRL